MSLKPELMQSIRNAQADSLGPNDEELKEGYRSGRFDKTATMLIAFRAAEAAIVFMIQERVLDRAIDQVMNSPIIKNLHDRLR